MAGWLLSAGLACLIGGEMAQADEPQINSDSISDGWVLTWSDEFDGEAIDTQKWEVLTRKKNYNGESQYYLPEQAAVVDGLLRITTTNEPYDGKAYRSARLESWFEQVYGRFEVRAKIPTTQGIWPAIWLLPRSQPWPHGGEIDIMEHAGSRPTEVQSAYHFADAEGKHDHVYKVFTATGPEGEPVRFPDDFHVYAVEWSPAQIVFYVDGEAFYRIGADEVPISSTPMSVVLNTAVGGFFDGEPDETTRFPQYFDIDYVRVYSRVDAPKDRQPDPDPVP